MKQSKEIAWILAKTMSREELADKTGVTEELRIMADVSEDFRDRLVEVGIKAVAKKCKNLAQSLDECDDILTEKAEGKTWTLQEVQSIVDLVRAGKPVQIAPYDPDVDDDLYVVRACW